MPKSTKVPVVIGDNSKKKFLGFCEHPAYLSYGGMQRCGQPLTQCSYCYHYAACELHGVCLACPRKVHRKCLFDRWRRDDIRGIYEIYALAAHLNWPEIVVTEPKRETWRLMGETPWRIIYSCLPVKLQRECYRLLIDVRDGEYPRKKK